LPLLISNGLDAESYGGTLSMHWQIAEWWRLRMRYTMMETNIHPGRGSRDMRMGAAEGNDPNHIFVMHSSMDLPGDLEFDTVLRYVDRLPNPRTSAYLTLDLRLGWNVTEDFELAIVGRNLLDDSHPEFERAAGSAEVERSIFGTVTWRF
jgi:iron complex outermembrane recepter protein